MTSILFGIFTGLFIIVSIALVFIVLVQRPQGGGLTGAFGGGGGTDTAFGGRTGDALTVATITAFTIYLLLGIGLNITGNLKRQEAIEAANAPATPAETAPVENVPVTPITVPVTGTEPAPAPAPADAGAPEAPRPADPNAIPLPPGIPSPTQDPAPAPAPAPTGG
ncbi:MAG: preprotein translocase subunit SecG [Planctomycetaceae bacterium]|jgi:preprotein translocase subunit SecG|nr:preprotein translocase subunit SecG [Planctomycetaceae bacterium]